MEGNLLLSGPRDFGFRGRVSIGGRCIALPSLRQPEDRFSINTRREDVAAVSR